MVIFYLDCNTTAILFYTNSRQVDMDTTCGICGMPHTVGCYINTHIRLLAKKKHSSKAI